MAPSKPTNVDVDKLKAALVQLQSIQYDVENPPPRSFSLLGTNILSSLQQSDGTGLQGNGASVADQRYQDATGYVTQGWRDVTSGVGALVEMVQTTISQHSTADDNAAQSANSTNTSTTAAGAD